MSTRKLLIAVFAFTLSANQAGLGQQRANSASGEWRWPGGDAGFKRYAPLDQIRKENVSRLTIAWRRPAVDASLGTDVPYSHDFKATPLMIDGVLYGSNGIGLVEAFHPGTGQDAVGAAAVSRRTQSRAHGRQHTGARVLDRGRARSGCS